MKTFRFITPQNSTAYGYVTAENETEARKKLEAGEYDDIYDEEFDSLVIDDRTEIEEIDEEEE